MVYPKAMVSIFGKMVALTKAISSKAIEMAMEFGQAVLQVNKLTKVTTYLIRKMDMVFTIGEMVTATKAVLLKINDVDRGNYITMINLSKVDCG